MFWIVFGAAVIIALIFEVRMWRAIWRFAAGLARRRAV